VRKKGRKMTLESREKTGNQTNDHVVNGKQGVTEAITRTVDGGNNKRFPSGKKNTALTDTMRRANWN